MVKSYKGVKFGKRCVKSSPWAATLRAAAKPKVEGTKLDPKPIDYPTTEYSGS